MDPRQTDPRSGDPLIEAALALAAPVEHERVMHEIAQQAHRLLGADAVAVALRDEEVDGPVLAHLLGVEDRDSVQARLQGAWRDAFQGRPSRQRHGRTTSLTVPLSTSADAQVLGALTVSVDGDAGASDALLRAGAGLPDFAALAAAALARVQVVRMRERQARRQAEGDAATGMARELRGSLGGIQSAAQLLRFRIREDPVVETNVGRVLRETERLGRMASTLLEYGRAAPAPRAAGDPEMVWDRVIAEHQGTLESRAQKLARTRASGHARCLVDAERLAMVFGALLANAAEAAPEASDLALVGELSDGGGWRCRLTNGGPAIGPEVVARAFDLFYSTRPGASGIGLALARRIAEEHGGSLTLSSDARGTSATVTLPPA